MYIVTLLTYFIVNQVLYIKTHLSLYNEPNKVWKYLTGIEKSYHILIVMDAFILQIYSSKSGNYYNYEKINCGMSLINEILPSVEHLFFFRTSKLQIKYVEINSKFGFPPSRLMNWNSETDCERNYRWFFIVTNGYCEKEFAPQYIFFSDLSIPTNH